MRLLKLSTGLLAGYLLAACHSPDPPPPPVKNVFDPLTQQMDRAKAVQGVVDAHAEDVKKSVDAEDRGENPP